jgi:hypothetical protein
VFLLVTSGAAGLAVYLSLALADPLGLARGASLVLCGVITLAAARPVLRALQLTPIDVWRPPSYFGAIYLIYFGVGPLPALWRTDALHDPAAVGVYGLSLGVALVGLVAAQFGCGFVTRRKRTRRRDGGLLWDRTAASTVLVAVLGFVWFERLRLESAGMFFKGSIAIQDLASVDRAFVVFHQTLSLLVAGLAAYCRYWLGVRRGPLGVACLAVVGGEAMYWFLANGRTQVALVLVSCAIVAAAARGRPRLRGAAVVAAVFVGLVYPLGGVMRGVHGEMKDGGHHVSSMADVAMRVVPSAVDRLESGYFEWLTSPAERDYQSVRLNGVNMLAAVVFQDLYGGQALLYGDALRFGLPLTVPRLLWPAKPEHDLDVEAFINYRFGLPIIDTMISPQTEFYADFGILGVVGGMFVWGMIMAGADALLIARHRSTAALLTYAASITHLVWPAQSFSMGVLAALRNGFILWGTLWMIERVIAVGGHATRSVRAGGVARVRTHMGAMAPSWSPPSACDDASAAESGAPFSGQPLLPGQVSCSRAGEVGRGRGRGRGDASG